MKLFARTILVLLFMASVALGQELFGVGEQADSKAPASQEPNRPPPRRAATRNPPNIVDRLVHVETADAWSAGTLVNANVHADEPARIALGYRESGFPRRGTWTGPETRTAFEFTNLIVSFNPTTPDQTGVVLDVRVRHGEEWSPWLFMQSWGQTTTPVQRTVSYDHGKVDIDELVLSKPADAYQLRITLMSFGFDVKNPPSVRRLSVCYSSVVEDDERRAAVSPPTPTPSNWARDLKVPFRPQGDPELPRALWGMICSPTSVSMVMEYFGVNHGTLENCIAIHDPHYNLFGNWGRAVSHAGAEGLDAWLERFRNWDQVKQLVAEGLPVIASIRFDKGEVHGFLYQSTRGHLLVIRGFTEDGDVIVNDPASRLKGNGPIYPAGEFARAWFDNGGVGYVIRGKLPETDSPGEPRIARDE